MSIFFCSCRRLFAAFSMTRARRLPPRSAAERKEAHAGPPGLPGIWTEFGCSAAHGSTPALWRRLVFRASFLLLLRIFQLMREERRRRNCVRGAGRDNGDNLSNVLLRCDATPPDRHRTFDEALASSRRRPVYIRALAWMDDFWRTFCSRRHCPLAACYHSELSTSAVVSCHRAYIAEVIVALSADVVTYR